MNNSVALHGGDVGSDNLQLQVMTTTDEQTGKQHGGKNTVSDQGQHDGRRVKRKEDKTEEGTEN